MARDPDPKQSASSVVRSALPETAGGVGGALVGFAVGGPVGAVIGAVAAPAAAALHEITRNALQQRSRRAVEALEAAAALRGVSEGELEQSIIVDEERLALALTILTAVADSPMAEKREALARVLAGGSEAEDEQAIDHYWALARALRDIDRPQVAVLQALSQSVEGSLDGLAPEELSREVGLAPPDLRFGVRSLELHGAITDIGRRTLPDNEDPVLWQITTLGLECLAYLSGTTHNASLSANAETEEPHGHR